MMFKQRILAASIAAIVPCGAAVAADEAKPTRMEEVVVTAPMMAEPLTVVTDPKAPRQPVPAHDGADYLKTIPGFSVIRKGGTDGDPVLRGLAGSRLNVLMDDQYIQGGCGMRMDPPTAYVFPEAYDKITVLKGPQTVLYGGGNLAGTALFERKPTRFETAGSKVQGSLMVGGFGRNDQMVDASLGNPTGFVRLLGTRSDANDYEDGDGRKVHSAYTRWSTGAVAGWTPDKDTRLELSLDRSDGQAAYADRTMDGTKFEREGYGLKFEKANLSPLVEKVEAQAYHNYVDHVMDNYTLRPQPGMKMVNNPDRTTDGARVAVKLAFSQQTRAKVGVDYQKNSHTLRTTVNYASMPRVPDMTFENLGVFGELTHDLSQRDRIVAGLRFDDLDVKDEKIVRNTSDNTKGGFARYERDVASMPMTTFIGLGHAERPADWWERSTYNSFYLKPEKNTQLDAGLIYNGIGFRTSVSAFYGKINDYISTYVKDNTKACTVAGNCTASNIDATLWGGEAELSYSIAKNWTAYGTLAYVRGENDSRNVALAQISPLEARLGLNYDDKVWSAGGLMRLVSEQDRVDPTYGSIVGQDIGRTAGFSVFSLNAGYRPKKGTLISGGIDNLFDKTYAEHISRGGAAVSGFTQTTRINELGRNLWVKLNIALD